MPSSGSSSRASTLGTPLLVAFLGGTVLLSSWLAWEAVEAARSQRQVAEEVLEGYSAVAASESARLTRDELNDVVDELFDDVPRFTRRTRLPGPEEVSREVDEALESGCPCPGFRSPLLVFRHDPEDDAVTVHGRPDPAGREGPEVGGADPEVRAVVAALHDHRLQGGEEPFLDGITLLPASGHWPSSALLYHVTLGGDDEVRAVYGFLVPEAALDELVRHRLGRSPLLPASIVGDLPQDSLLSVRVVAHDGRPLAPSPQALAPAPFSARADLSQDLSSLGLEVAIRPEAADQLVIGGLPRSRLPLLLGLLLLTVGLGGAGLVELRRSQELTRLREDFVSSVSHELRTPLTQIRMLAELLEEEKLPDEASRARSTRVIRREAQRLTMLVENILQFARGRAAPTVAPAGDAPVIDLRDVVAEEVSLLEAVGVSEGSRIRLETGDEAVLASLHRDGLRRVVGNLLDNALKYGPPEQTVVVRVRQSAVGAVVEVEDEGPGIPAEMRDSVFEPYQRLARDVEARRPGSGLGLAVVRSVVGRYGGEVEAGVGPAGGARFTVRFPHPPQEA